ncbi:MAG: glycosyltransferase family 4 protein [Woeseiaceae bacterium]
MRERTGDMTRPSICFIAHNALSAITGTSQEHVGGIERQQATMAKWLADRDWDVSVITWDDGDPTPAYVEKIRIVTLCRRSDGWPAIRFAVPRWSSLIAALSKVDADVYYYNCGDLGLGQIVMWARKANRAVVFSVPSDPDCDPGMPSLTSFRERLLYRHGLKNCRHVVVQSSKQRAMLERHFSKGTTLLPMPCHGFPQKKRSTQGSTDKPFEVLWVGRISPEKRPEWLLDVARRLPDVQFKVAGAPNRQTAYSDRIETAARSLQNFTMLGRVPYREIARHYNAADLLCCTSVYEGFPNAFLEAWSTGLPVISTCDPDDKIATLELGAAADSVEAIVNQIIGLRDNPGKLSSISANAKDYFVANHSIDTAMPRFNEYFHSVRAMHVTQE